MQLKVARSAIEGEETVNALNPIRKIRWYLAELAHWVKFARNAVAIFLNVGLTLLYGNVIKRIQLEIFKNSLAEFRKQAIEEPPTDRKSVV